MGAVRGGQAPGAVADATMLASLVDEAYDAVVVTSLEGRITYWNRAAERLYGRGRGLELGGELQTLVPEVVRPQIPGILAVVAEGDVIAPSKRVHTYASGVMAMAEVAATPVRDADGAVSSAAFFVRYNVEGMEPGGPLAVAAAEALHDGQVSARRALMQAEARYRAIVATAEQGIALIDDGGRYLFVNDRLAAFLGVAQDELVGVSACALTRDSEGVASVAATGLPRRYEVFHAHPSGATLCGLVTVTSVEDGEAGPGTVLLMVSDITDLKRGQEERERRSVIDPLTELANATLFYDRVDRAVRLAPEGARAAVLVADVDRFRDVSDAFGHGVADDLLRAVGTRIVEVCPGDATVARIVGDQFAVFVEEPGDQDDLAALADRIHRAVSAPAFFGTLELVPSVSIGVALAIGDGARPATPSPAEAPQLSDDVLRRAHGAMRVARRGGPGRTAVDDVRSLDTVAARLEMIPELHRAIRAEQLDVVFQPVIDLASGRTRSVEALVRWNHPERGVLDPSAFIPVAEDSGLIGDLGRWVLDRACRTAVEWHAAGRLLPVAVNVSGRQLAEERVVDDVREVIARTGIDPSLLVLEVTESVLVDDRHALVERLGVLRELGCRIAIDDFGTGYSSLAQLGRLPLDVLKVDRMFVNDIAVSERAVALVRSVVDVAEAFGLDVIAEGVETEAQRLALVRLGCPAAQGFYWATPMSREDLRGWFASSASATGGRDVASVPPVAGT